MQQAESAILAQNIIKLIHNQKLRRVLLAAILPFAGVMAAFGIAPDTVTDNVLVQQVVENVDLPALKALEQGPQRYWHEERVQRGDTIGSLLARLGVEDPEAEQFIRTAKDARSLYQLAPGRVVRALTTDEGKLLTLTYVQNGMELTVQQHGDGYQVSEQKPALETRVMMKSAEIHSSLFAATDAAELSDGVATQLADIFSTDIDFQRDLRRGDRFTVVYEMLYHNGEPARPGRVLAAEFVIQGKRYQAIWFKDDEHAGGYYTTDGKNIRKAFLRSPLEFSRITSGFTTARFHPILQKWRAHKGVDYGAPTGTRVKATADGVVEIAGRHGGYGNLIVLRHQSKYTTWYGHLSGFAPGIHRGAHVTQGEVIGYVGATGLATGPHLHYEFRVNDHQQDPLRVVMPEAPPITPDRRAAFESVAHAMEQRLGLLRATNVAAAD
jgi:murein DD-endopeptidase MepM/ murein hydrolase activator NlpD